MKPTATACAFVASLLTACSAGVAHAAAVPALAFEDTNNNGVFDGSDVNITNLLKTEWIFSTPNSVVIMGGALAIPDPHFKQTGACGGVHITAGRKITVNSSILAPFYAGDVNLYAGEHVRIGDNVTLNARNRVSVYCDQDIDIGSNVKLISKGGSANFGSATIYAQGAVRAGTKLSFSTLTESAVYAQGGELVMGAGSKLTSTKSGISLSAKTNMTINSVELKGRDTVSINAGLLASNFIHMRLSKVSVGITAASGGSISASCYNGTIDATGAKFMKVTPGLWAAHVIQ